MIDDETFVEEHRWFSGGAIVESVIPVLKIKVFLSWFPMGFFSPRLAWYVVG